MGYVHQIHDQLIVGRGVVLAINLGVPGEPCFGLEAQAELRQILLILGGNLRPLGTRTTDGHISLEDIQKLGKLVDADLADKPTYRGDTVILIAGRETGHAVLLRVHPHTAELEDLKDFPVLGEALLLVEHRAVVMRFDGNRRTNEHR